MLFSSIDIGSNAVRLLFANVYETKNGPVTEKASLIRIPIRLGLDVFYNGRISEQRADDFVKTMRAFKLLIDVYKPVGYKVAATSAMREASNNNEVLNRVKEETGLVISMIDGIEEANIISSLNNVLVNKSYSKTLYIDVGGGSTELSLLDGEHFITSNSFKIGTIRLLAGKVEDSEWDNMRKWLKQFKNDFGKMNCFGSGGNINKITKMYGQPILNTISPEQLNYAYKHLSKMSLEKRIEQLGLRPDRADVIVPAAQIFVRILKWTGINKVIAPKLGLADGLVLLQFKEMKEKGLI
ncbi:MAG: Ppx/GppA family phosphatase [Lentimicrobium sp.]|jgi:exopolyphosphatase/guanosine-5'-triphosphate,3'-diphosphate pyrophosphatase|nr:Ppx/GppA family phosphatase [Lentimicrobium sp.]